MVTYTKPTAPGTLPTSYSLNVCTDSAMTMNCLTTANYTSGNPVTGLTQGTTYYATITGVSTTSGFSSVTVGPSSAMASVQLAVPTVTSVGPGSVVGTITVAGGSSNAQAGATYTLKACTNSGMSTGCVTNNNYTPGTNFAVSYTLGNAATNYFVTLAANNSTGYIASTASTPAVSGAELGQLNAPTAVTLLGVAPSHGLKVTFTESGTAPVSSYTVEVCTNKGMTTGCVTVTNYTSGAQITVAQGIVSGKQYFGEVTAIGPVGYLSNTSAVSPTGNFGVTAS